MEATKRSGPQVDVTLFPKQAEVLQSNATEILYGGAAGGGKSHLLRSAAIIWAMSVPGLQIYFFRRTYPDLEKNHLNGPKAFPIMLASMINKSFVVWNKQKYVFQFWNGSAIFLNHCEKETDRFRYYGPEIHVLMIDELSQFTAVIYRFLRTRVRMIGMKVPKQYEGAFPKIVCGSNPGGFCHNFMRATWVDRAKPMEVWRAPNNEGGMLRQFIPARIIDNPALVEDDPEYVNRIAGLGDPAMVRALLEGDFNIISGGMFDDVWDEKVHIIKPFEIPSSWYLNRAFDMGSSKPFAIGWFAESDGCTVTLADGRAHHFPKGTVFQIGEWYGWNGEPDEGCGLDAGEIAVGIKEREAALPEMKFKPGPADTSIWDGLPPKTDADVMERVKIRWIPADKGPGSRVAGWRLLRQMLKNSLVGKDLPGFYVFDNCLNTIRTLPSAPRSKTNTEDVDTKYEDHALDMLRYRLMGGKMTVNTLPIRIF